MKQVPRKRGERHGNARNALLESAEISLEQVGAAGLSLRQLSDAAGLSRQAPYNHFADKETLLAELVRLGFNRLESAILEIGDPSAAGALASAGEAYIRCAQATPALFRLMFSRELVDLKKFPDVRKDADAAFARLKEIVANFAPVDRVDELTLLSWSLVHGYATLCLELKLESESMRELRAKQFAHAVHTAARSATNLA